MKVKTLKLKNFRGFEELTLEFSDGLTVLVGENGAGKSSVLDALAIMLSWAIARVRAEHGQGQKIKNTDIHNESAGATVRSEVAYQDVVYEWTQVKSAPGMKNGDRSDWAGSTRFADVIREEITESNALCSVPIMVYYGTNRAVNEIPVGVPKNRHIFELLECYESAVTGSTVFESFFEWFRAREDLENEVRLRVAKPPYSAAKAKLYRPDRDLKSVKSALNRLLPDFDDFSVQRRESSLVAEKRGRTVRLDQLSDGEKCLIAMVGDLARRLSLANPTLEDPLHGEGIVLIDEIELHLHPAWQRSIIGNLRRVFPNIQFIITTHSPQVLGEVAHDDIRRLIVGEDGQISISTPRQSLGLDSNQVLEEVLGAPSRNEQVTKQIEAIFRNIDREDKKSLARARDAIKKLEEELDGNIPDLVEAEALLFMLDGE